jgi:hypothetical protein
MTTLHDAIFAFVAAQKDYSNCTSSDDEDHVSSIMQEAETVVLNWPCRTMEEVCAKARFVLKDDGMQDTLLNCYDGQEPCLLPFLRSLCADTANAGPNVDGRAL